MTRWNIPPSPIETFSMCDQVFGNGVKLTTGTSTTKSLTGGGGLQGVKEWVKTYQKLTTQL